jgi:hypothetical protein
MWDSQWCYTKDFLKLKTLNQILKKKVKDGLPAVAELPSICFLLTRINR